MGLRLIILGLLALPIAGCHRNMPVGQARVAEPGAHVISSPGATSVIWSDGRTRRVCTLPSSGLRGSKRMKGMMPGGMKGHAGGGAGIDAFLFRLCEARGNGDITPEQYFQALTKLEKVMKKAHSKGRMMPKQKEWGPKGQRGEGPKGKGRRRGGPGRPGRPDGPGPAPPDGPPVENKPAP